MNRPQWPTTPGLTITSGYGWRTHPIFGDLRFHHAIDIGGGGVNHPIYATQDGYVMAKLNTSYGGYTIRLIHTGDEYFSQYQHMQAPSHLNEGVFVTKGQRIGYMGNTGDSSGIHLDFQIATSTSGFHTEDGTIDPELYLDLEFDPTDPPGPGPTTRRKSKFKPWLYTRKRVTIWQN